MTTVAAKSKKAEKTKEELRKLTLLEDNKYCIDCGMRGPLYVVLDFHIFVCSQCSAIHRSAQHKVKGISMSDFSDEELLGMKVGGNATAKKVWLSGFRGPLPREGDEKAIKDHIRHIFEEKRFYSQQAFAEFKASLTEATASTSNLPPVQPMPAHIVAQLAPVPQAQPRHTDARQSHSAPTPLHQQPQQSPSLTTPSHDSVAAAPQQRAAVSPAQPPPQPPQRPVDVFDTIFQQPPPQKPLGSYPQQPTPAMSMEFFGENPQQQQQQQPMNRNLQHAAQVQMHSTQYQPQMANAQAAQAQMGSVFDGQRYHSSPYQQQSAPPMQSDVWGAQAAQRQMTPQYAAYSSETPYAAQHQMNTGSAYATHGYAPAAPDSTGPAFDFFAPPGANANAPGNRGSTAGWDFGGPPPIPAKPLPSASSPQGPPANANNGHGTGGKADPFASLDFFSSKK